MLNELRKAHFEAARKLTETEDLRLLVSFIETTDNLPEDLKLFAKEVTADMMEATVSLGVVAAPLVAVEEGKIIAEVSFAARRKAVIEIPLGQITQFILLNLDDNLVAHTVFTSVDMNIKPVPSVENIKISPRWKPEVVKGGKE